MSLLPAPFHRWPLAILFICWLPLRVLFYLTYWPWICGDTATFYWLFRAAYQQSFVNYDGERPPGYPLFIQLIWYLTGPGRNLSDSNCQAIVLGQMALSLILAGMVYAIVYTVTSRRWVAAITGVCHAAAMNLMVTEVSILSELLTAFCITALSLYLLKLSRKRVHEPTDWILLGWLVTFTAFIRPNNLFFIPLILLTLLLGLFPHIARGKRLVAGGLFTAASVIPIVAWCGFLSWHTGCFGITSNPGFNLTHKTIDFVALAPPRFAHLRDILARYERNTLARLQDPHHSIPLDSRVWFAYREIVQLPEYRSITWHRQTAAISHDLMQLSESLIYDHPMLYLQAVAEACGRFWQPSLYGPVRLDEDADPATISGGNVVARPQLQQVLVHIATVLNGLTQIIYVMFAIVVAGVLTLAVAGYAQRVDPFIWFALATLTCAMLSCAVIEYGNGRFILPYQPLLYATVGIAVSNLMARSKTRKQS